MDAEPISSDELAAKLGDRIKNCDWPAVIRLAAALRTHLPDIPEDVALASTMVGPNNQIDETSPLVAELIAFFRQDWRTIVTTGAEAQQSKDWARASHLYRLGMIRYPEDPAVYRGMGLTLRGSGDAEAAIAHFTSAIARFPHQTYLKSDLIWTVLGAGDQERALTLSDDLRKSYPHLQDGHQVYAIVQSRKREFDESDRALTVAIKLFPRAVWPLTDYARNAHLRGDWPEAARRWTDVRARLPDHPEGLVMGGIALRHAGDFDYADQILSAAACRLPNEAAIATELIFTAMARNDYQETLDRWKAARSLLPEAAATYALGASVMRFAAQIQDAADLVQQGLEKYPDDVELALERAQVASQVDDANAPSYWLAVVKRRPSEIALSRLATAQRRASRHEEAEKTLDFALHRFPNDVRLGIERAWLAQCRADWPEAQRRWTALVARFPGEVSCEVGLQNAALDAAPATADGKADDNSPEAILRDPRRLMLEFESLGQNCEFGQVQRHYGAEPLGLFRFVGSFSWLTIRAIEDDLSGIGEPEFTFMEAEGADGEYYTKDTRYLLRSHTFHFNGKSDFERLFQSACRKLRFLAKRFCEDLHDPRKIYVFRAALPMPEFEIAALYRAISRYGDGILLCVMTTVDTPNARTVRRLDDRLFVAYVDRLGITSGSNNFDCTDWLDILRTVYRYVRIGPMPAIRELSDLTNTRAR